jgi:hypothetical protein
MCTTFYKSRCNVKQPSSLFDNFVGKSVGSFVSQTTSSDPILQMWLYTQSPQYYPAPCEWTSECFGKSMFDWGHWYWLVEGCTIVGTLFCRIWVLCDKLSCVLRFYKDKQIGKLSNYVAKLPRTSDKLDCFPSMYNYRRTLLILHVGF